MKHAVKRSEERWGGAMTADDYASIIAQIEAGILLRIRKPSQGAAGRKKLPVYMAWCESLGDFLPVVFNPETRTVVTVLPAEAAEVQRFYSRALFNPPMEEVKAK